MKTAGAIVVLMLASLAAFVPFIHKPLFVDDHAVFAQARDLALRPRIPYAMEPGKLGWTPGHGVGEDNPPVFFYAVALAIHQLGDDPWKSRAAMIPLQMAGLLAFFLIAGRFTRYPLWASLLFLVSPHFWVTSNSLLVDSILAPVMLLAIWTWIKTTETRSVGWGVLAVCFLTLAPLVKYTGLLTWGVAALWLILLTPPQRSRLWVGLVFPVLGFGVWLWYSRSLYGADHFTAVAQSRMTWPAWDTALTLGAFIAATIPILFLPFVTGLFAGGGRRMVVWLIAAAALDAAFFTGHGPVTNVQLGAWAAVGFGALGFMFSGRFSRERLWWAAWSMLGLVGLAFALGWVCARFLVIVGAPLTLWSVRTLEERHPFWIDSLLFRGGSLLLLGGYGFLVMHADWTQAHVNPQAARWAMEWKTKNAPRMNAYYPGAAISGLGTYLPGWKKLDAGQLAPVDSLLLIPRRTLSAALLPQAPLVRAIASREFKTWNRIRVLDSVAGSGFYGSIWGPLPIAFSKAPIEVYSLLQVESGRRVSVTPGRPSPSVGRSVAPWPFKFQLKR